MSPPKLTLSQLLQIRFARARRWEFWNGWLFYLPVVAYIAWLSLVRYRPFAAFTAVNPGMSNAGGLIGEAKTELLLPLQQARPGQVAAFVLIDAGSATERAQQATDFQASIDSPWPLVLKPDVSERGRGVRVCHSLGAIHDYFERFSRPTLAQAFVAGEEFGVFFTRNPGAATADDGELFSIVEKQFPEVVGNGHDTLAELILAHERAWLNAPMLFERLSDRLETVPPAGQVTRLADVGSHCRGSTFINGKHLATPALRAAICDIVGVLPGFDFGRMDIRAESAAALAQGEGFKIIEINGASSEPAHVYHPGTPLSQGVAAFCESWRRMHAIGAANARNGVNTLGLFELALLPLRERRKLRGVDWPSNVWAGDAATRARSSPPGRTT